MKRWWIGVAVCCLLVLVTMQHAPTTTLAQSDTSWPQWGKDPQHAGFISVVGQPINRQLADLIYDPFVAQEQAEEEGDLLAHYQVPILHGNDVFMAFKTGRYISCNPPGSGIPPAGETACGPFAWESQIFNERRYHWQGGALVQKWNFQSDWKPMSADLVGEWEPVFHAVLAGDFVYVPNAGGTISKVDKGDGTEISRINPFGSIVDPNTFVAGPLTADAAGNIYYNVLQLNPLNPFADPPGSWLVKVATDDTASKVAYTTLVAGAPTTCLRTFTSAQLPWPPSPSAVPTSSSCGPQRPGVNVAPAIAPDGTIYTVSRTHRNSFYSYMVAVNADLTPKWATSMRDLLNDGCGFLVPIGTTPTTPNACRMGQPANGVDPATNRPGAARVIDPSSSSPTVLPDGSVAYGAYTRYNVARGHLMKFSSSGAFLAAYDFGWDSTAATFSHDGTYSIVIKDNHYDVGRYCNPFQNAQFCQPLPQGPYFITQLKANLGAEWKFKNTNTQSCTRNPDGTLTCVSNHPNGFEWCINAPAIDANGVVYANSEDGNLYTINQGGTERQRKFLNLAIGAAYTPLSISGGGLTYTENDGHMFVVGQ